MISIFAHASAKLIIAGEHAVVYRRPAIAVPVSAIRAQVQIVTAPHGQGCIIHSPDLARSGQLGVDSDPLLDLVSDGTRKKSLRTVVAVAGLFNLSFAALLLLLVFCFVTVCWRTDQLRNAADDRSASPIILTTSSTTYVVSPRDWTL
jgi:hypothetical protein